MTREIGIIERSPMVRAILDGRKWQTRRPMKPQPDWVADGVMLWRGAASIARLHPKLPYRTGDRLWVRETWAHDGPDLDACRRGVESDGLSCGPYYRATARPFDVGSLRWRSPIHMPKWAARIWLTVTDVRVQRVQEISEEDARAEGSLYVPGHGEITLADLRGDPGYSNYLNCRQGFEIIWNDTRGPGAWERNDWVVAVSFERAP